MTCSSILAERQPSCRCRLLRSPNEWLAVKDIHRGQQYSIIAVTGGGSVTERYANDAYGTPTILDTSGTSHTISAKKNRYTYTGREYDGALELYHYRNRMYDSVADRFCSRDPIKFQGSQWNLYEYGESRVLAGTDPTGLAYSQTWFRCGGKLVRQNPGQTKKCCGGKPYDSNKNCCWNNSFMGKDETEEVTLTFREAGLPGGNAANAICGKNHCSAKTSEFEVGQGKVGAGVPGQGAEGCACTIFTEMVDHEGQSEVPGVVNVKVTVSKCCFFNKVRPLADQGPWIPLINDCNTVMQDAVESCGGDWDSAYDNYLGQNEDYEDYWEDFPNGIFHGPKY